MDFNRQDQLKSVNIERKPFTGFTVLLSLSKHKFRKIIWFKVTDISLFKLGFKKVYF
jgi:hypothetical protein